MCSKNFIAYFITLLIIIGSCNEGLSTHNRAGEIIYEQTGDLSIRATIITYTRTSSFAADRDSLTLFWGDGDSTVVLRVNGTGVELPNDVKRNEYVADHLYPTRGTYKLSVSDPNRIAGIVNIDFPNSVNILFYIETTLTLLEPRFQGRNSSVVLLQPPIDLACVDQVYTYNPNAYDVDGDSISYELVTPFADRGVEVPNYELPDQISPGPNNTISLDPLTGDFKWDAPQALGEYNITYKINEYRNGLLINSMIRDMQILVRGCPEENNSPEITAMEEICVIAGEQVTLDILATDVDTGDMLSLTASGGPFELAEDRAILETQQNAENSDVTAQIIWQTTCDHVSKEPYQIVIRATDEPTRDEANLSALKTVRIFVTAPPPEELDIANNNNVVELSWSEDYKCNDGVNFRGFSVWRKINSSNVPIDTCRGGLEGQGYERIIFLTNEIVDNRYVALDPEIDEGEIYCYRVVPEFAQLTVQGNPYNRVQGIASEEICVRSSGEKPLMTKVSVIETDLSSGLISVNWINPNDEAIDTLILTGPYKLTLDHAENLNGEGLSFLDERSYLSGDFQTIDYTESEVANKNTMSTGHSFRVTFESGDAASLYSAQSEVASSVFLNSSGTDEQVNLSWSANVPWNNYQYYVYQQDSNQFFLLDSTTSTSLAVTGLINDQEYCYYIESHGKYGVKELPSPLINLSNESCAIPNDNVAPCPPSIEVQTICDFPTQEETIELENKIVWEFSDVECSEASDVSSYLIFYKPNVEAEFEEIDNVLSSSNIYNHVIEENIAGCYAIKVVDIGGNVSDFSNVICVDNCPMFELPNTFTPNGDNSNDIFTARQSRFIDRVEFTVFNRWGERVFETTDPKINWDGNSLESKPLSEATYFYTCVVFEKRVSGVVEADILKGTIQLIR